MSLTSKRLWHLVNDDSVWKMKIRDDYGLDWAHHWGLEAGEEEEEEDEEVEDKDKNKVVNKDWDKVGDQKANALNEVPEHEDVSTEDQTTEKEGETQDADFSYLSPKQVYSLLLVPYGDCAGFWYRRHAKGYLLKILWRKGTLEATKIRPPKQFNEMLMVETLFTVKMDKDGTIIREW